MKRPFPSLCLMISVSVLTACASSPPRVDGDWVGGVRVGATWHAARLHIVQSGDGISGSASVMALNVVDAPLEGSLNGRDVRFRVLARELSGLWFEGRDEADALRSDIREWNGPGFKLVRDAGVSAEGLSEYIGWYASEFEPAVVVMPGSEGGLRFFHLGRLSGTLLPVAGDELDLASFDQAPTVLRTKARFTRDASGQVTGLDIGDDPVAHKTRLVRIAQPEFRQQPIAFRNGDVTLGGVLFSPADDGPHPAVVFIHGTGYQTADNAYEMSLLNGFLERGIAVLLFDKRGCGSSAGSWRVSSLQDLAGDVVAAVAALRTNPTIDANKVGVYGISEGGWVAPIVAHSSRIAFLVNHGGPAVSPLEDELDDLTHGIGQLGLSQNDSSSAMALARAWVELYRSPDALPQYLSALAAARQQAWFRPFETRFPISDDDWEVQWWRKRGRLDPLLLWSTLEVPALVLIGENDDTMDVQKNVALFEGVEQSGRVDVRVVPDADHGLRVAGALAPRFPEEVAEWILEVAEGRK